MTLSRYHSAGGRTREMVRYEGGVDLKKASSAVSLFGPPADSSDSMR